MWAPLTSYSKEVQMGRHTLPNMCAKQTLSSAIIYKAVIHINQNSAPDPS